MATMNPYHEARIAELEQQLRDLLQLLRQLVSLLPTLIIRSYDHEVFADDEHLSHEAAEQTLVDVQNIVERLAELWPVEER